MKFFILAITLAICGVFGAFSCTAVDADASYDLSDDYDHGDTYSDEDAADGGSANDTGQDSSDSDTNTDADTDADTDASADTSSEDDIGSETGGTETDDDTSSSTESDWQGSTDNDTGDAVISDKPGNNCDTPRIAELGTNNGDSSDRSDTYKLDSCAATSGPDEIWAFTAPAEGTYAVEMNSSGVKGFPCLVQIFDQCGVDTGTICGRADPYESISSVEFTASQGEIVYILADDLTAGGDGGTYNLVITHKTPPSFDKCNTTPLTCVDVSPYESEQFHGCCLNNKVYWCQMDNAPSGDLHTEDCAAQGQTCKYNDLLGYVWCSD